MAMSAIRKTTPDCELDLCGLPCPFVLAELSQALSERGAMTVEVLCDHPTTVHETVPSFCRKHGYQLDVQPEIYPLHSQVYRLRIVA